MRFVVVLSCFTACLAVAKPPASDQAISRIGFGSCLHQGRKLDVLDQVVAHKPELFVFLGDNIYADTQNIEIMNAKYAKLGGSAEFQRLRQQVPLVATWDDHDYGANDAGVEFPMKAESKTAMLNFFGVPTSAAVRARPGVYQSYYFGEGAQRLQLILLDTRWFRSALKKNPGRKGYLPNPDPNGTILGEAQWRWLLRELQQPAALRIIGSSIQVLPAEHPWEAWSKLPAERTRLLTALKQRRDGAVLIISGDRHMAEIAKLDDLVEVTSSGLNRAGGGSPKEPNKLRVGTVYSKTNFGMLAIDWQQRNATISIHAKDGQRQLQHQVAIP